jgi:hypothetical protein
MTRTAAIAAFAVAFGLNVVGRSAETEKMELIGTDLGSWKEPHADWRIVGDVKMGGENDRFLIGDPGAGIMLNGPKGRTRNILSNHEHQDVQAHVEFMVPKGSNSGVYFQARYEVQVLDSWGVKKLKHGDCGGIYQRWKDGQGFEGHPPRVNASRPPGQWQTFDVIFRAARFDQSGKKVENARFVKVVHNGVVVHEDVELTGPTRASTYRDEQPAGPLMLQGDHGPVAYRNIWLRPIP